MKVEILYFAALRDRAGCERERIETAAATLAELYVECERRHALGFAREQLRVAQGGEFAGWDEAPRAGAEIAFIPPVSGG